MRLCVKQPILLSSTESSHFEKTPTIVPTPMPEAPSFAHSGLAVTEYMRVRIQ